MIESINAVTMATTDMARAVAFYQALGFALHYGGPKAQFTSLRIGECAINLRQADGPDAAPMVRIIFWVSDVDAQHAHLLEAGLTPDFAPRDASWGERYFHIADPDGHGLSFARRHEAPGSRQ